MPERISAAEDGRPVLQRKLEQSYDLSLTEGIGAAAEANAMPGLQNIDDQEEIYEEAGDRQTDSNVLEGEEGEDEQMLVIGPGDDDEEPVGSSDVSNDLSKLKSILKNRGRGT